MLEKPKTVVKISFLGLPPQKVRLRRTLACCNGDVTVKNGLVFVFCRGAEPLRESNFPAMLSAPNQMFGFTT